MTPQEFIKLLSDKIDKIKDFPVLKSLAIAQSCLESRYGEKSFYGNIFGIKCHDPNLYAGCRLGKTAEFVNGNYKNLSLAFQTYNNFDESLEDYARIMNLPRYKLVREAKDYLEATEAIRACGYATSISYTINLRKIIEKYKLYELDRKMDKNLQLTENFRYYEWWSNNFGKEKIEPPEEYFHKIKREAEQLQRVRDKLNEDFRPKKEIYILITSAYRTKEWNASKNVEGAKNSKHLTADAVDSRAVGVPLFVYYTYLVRYTDFNHLGYYLKQNFVHAGNESKIIIFKY